MRGLSVCQPALQARSSERFWRGLRPRQARRRCGIGTFSARATTTLNCRTTVWRRIGSFCRSLSASRETGIPMAATNDAHYITKEDAKMQSILLCIQTGKTINDVDRMEFQTDEFYLKSTDEMYELFSMVPEACENTNKIAEQCNFAFTFGETKLPYFRPLTAWKIRPTLRSSAGRDWNAVTPER